MYEYVRGSVEQLTPTGVVVEAGGVGYYLAISLQTYSQIGDATQVKLYTHYIVREDAQLLYGFYTRAEREVFRLLIGVSGVGGNTARMILSSFTAEEVRTLVATGQAEVLKSVKGLGIKTAQKIIVELRDKIGSIGGESPVLPGVGAASDAVYQEALSALMMLGFVRTASEKVLQGILREQPGVAVEELIRLALKKL